MLLFRCAWQASNIRHNFLYNFRERISEKKLDKAISDKSRIRRRKLLDVNIKITFIVWLTEFIFSFLFIFVPKIFGHGQVATETGYVLSVTFYFVLLPFLYLVNDSDVKNTIADESWFRAIRRIFNKPTRQVAPE